MAQIIPTTQDSSSYVETITLDNKIYRFLFNWNTRDENWYLTISDKDDNVILAGLKLVVNYELLGIYQWLIALPAGYLIAVDMNNTGEPAGRYDLGNRVLLMYYDRDEI